MEDRVEKRRNLARKKKMTMTMVIELITLYIALIDQNKLIQFIDFVSNLFSLNDNSFYEVIGLGKSIVYYLIKEHAQYCKSRMGPPSLLKPTSEVILILIYLKHGSR